MASHHFPPTHRCYSFLLQVLDHKSHMLVFYYCEHLCFDVYLLLIPIVFEHSLTNVLDL